MSSLNRSNMEYVKRKNISRIDILRDPSLCRKPCLFHKVLENENPIYLFSLIFARHLLYLTQNIHNIPLLNKKTF